MKRLLSLLTLTLSALADASSQETSIYTFDSGKQNQPSARQEISASAAELIVARRLGFTDTSELGRVDENVIQALNKFGGRQSALLGDSESERDVARFLVVWDTLDTDHSSSSFSKDSTGNLLVVRRPPVNFLDLSFIDGLAEPSAKATSRFCSYDLQGDGIDGQLLLQLTKGGKCRARSSKLNKESLIDMFSQSIDAWEGRPDAAILRITVHAKTTESKSILHDIAGRLAELSRDSNQQSTLAIVPRQTKSNSQKRSPGFGAEQQPTQEPAPEEPQKAPKVSAQRQSNGLPSTMLPVCHATNASCNEATQNCSGRGSCYLKHGKKEGSAGDCYACKCTRTTITHDDGTVKTTQWGGPACQKKDVSTPFFIIGGFTVLLVVAISLGIKLLFSIGQEELPSVLSAGVAAPRAQK